MKAPFCFLAIIALSSSLARGQSPNCAPTPPGAVGWWKGESNALDSAGGNNATIIGGVTYGAGKVGQGFVFNGISGFVTVPASQSMNVGASNGFTVEGWINPNTLATQPLAEWNTGDGFIGAHLWISASPFGSGAA